MNWTGIRLQDIQHLGLLLETSGILSGEQCSFKDHLSYCVEIEFEKDQDKIKERGKGTKPLSRV